MFRKLKKKFIKELVLTVLNLDKKMRIKVDVLDHVIRRVLSMILQNELLTYL